MQKIELNESNHTLTYPFEVIPWGNPKIKQVDYDEDNLTLHIFYEISKPGDRSKTLHLETYCQMPNSIYTLIKRAQAKGKIQKEK